MSVRPPGLALLLASSIAWSAAPAPERTRAPVTGPGKTAPAPAHRLGCYTRFQSSAWASNIHGVYATNTGKRTLATGTRIAWTVRMARNCTDEEASQSLNVGEFVLSAPFAPGTSVKIAEATTGSTGGRSYTIAGCEAEVIK
jgi:hypothetical protein